MAVTIEGAIEQALMDRLGTLVLTPAHTIAYPNIDFTKPVSNRYLEAKFVPNVTERRFIGSDEPHERLGFLQVNVRDKANTANRITDVAGAVAAHFPADLKLRHATGLMVRITAAPSVASMLVENTPPGVVVPVLVPWECWA
jgi:hypothetical protein